MRSSSEFRRKSLAEVSDAKLVENRRHQFLSAVTATKFAQSINGKAAASNALTLSTQDAIGLPEAEALGLSLAEFLALEPEPPLYVLEDHIPPWPCFRYSELVRRNFRKEYEAIRRTELELHLSEDEFQRVFEMSKVSGEWPKSSSGIYMLVQIS